MSGRLEGQAAIVTGGASGIGLAVASRLVREGASVLVADVSPERTAETVRGLLAGRPGAAVFGRAVDVRREDQVNAMRDEALERFGRIDILVASAGILRGVPGKPQTLADTSADAWDRVIETNLTGMFLTIRAVLPVMQKQRRGNIITLSSMSGRKGVACDSAYCASKFGVIGLSESLAEEVRPYGIRVQSVLPEVVDTPILAQNGPIFRPRDMLSAERVADFILYLVALPEDTWLLNPVIAPSRARRSTT
ncbi:MAG TPA: SDR family oxidoreductase [Candidatus Polarisedimenticolia bacterium]|nr:SDR family oxidoreductase [Candidatus Polarisedimenticolia bacterium]